MFTGYSSSGGAPGLGGAGYAGSGKDNGRTCAAAGCHSGPATARDGMIAVSGLPQDGYLPGQTYTIEITGQGNSTKMGFQATVQDANNNIAGSVATTDNQTRLVSGSAGYITQTAAGNSVSGGSKTWSFQWTAPAAGTGSVNVYTAVNVSNNNGGTSGDQILFDTFTIAEQVVSGISSVDGWQETAAWFQGQSLQIAFTTERVTHVTVTDLQGRRMAAENSIAPGSQRLSLDGSFWPAGMYLVVLSSGDAQSVMKVMKY